MNEKKSPCCNETYIRYISMNMKVCWKCRKEYNWDLDENQKPLFDRSPD